MERILESFRKQIFMQTLGATLLTAGEGEARISCDIDDSHRQQHGFVHAGVLASILDSACGYAALSKMPEDSEVVSVEFKISLLRPCKASTIIARGSVLRTGKTLVFTEGTVTDGEERESFATMTATMYRVRPKH